MVEKDITAGGPRVFILPNIKLFKRPTGWELTSEILFRGPIFTVCLLMEPEVCGCWLLVLEPNTKRTPPLSSNNKCPKEVK